MGFETPLWHLLSLRYHPFESPLWDLKLKNSTPQAQMMKFESPLWDLKLLIGVAIGVVMVFESPLWDLKRAKFLTKLIEYTV